MPWKKKDDPASGFVVPDFIPEDETGPVSAPGASDEGVTFGPAEEMQQTMEQSQAEAIHRLRSSKTAFMVITPLEEDEELVGFNTQIMVTGNLPFRMNAYLGLGQALTQALPQLAMALGIAMQELAQAVAAAEEDEE